MEEKGAKGAVPCIAMSTKEWNSLASSKSSVCVLVITHNLLLQTSKCSTSQSQLRTFCLAIAECCFWKYASSVHTDTLTRKSIPCTVIWWKFRLHTPNSSWVIRVITEYIPFFLFKSGKKIFPILYSCKLVWFLCVHKLDEFYFKYIIPTLSNIPSTKELCAIASWPCTWK